MLFSLIITRNSTVSRTILLSVSWPRWGFLYWYMYFFDRLGMKSTFFSFQINSLLHIFNQNCVLTSYAILLWCVLYVLIELDNSFNSKVLFQKKMKMLFKMLIMNFSIIEHFKLVVYLCVHIDMYPYIYLYRHTYMEIYVYKYMRVCIQNKKCGVFLSCLLSCLMRVNDVLICF